MRIEKVKSRILLVIVLLLVGGFVLVGTLLPKAIGANISFTISGPTSNLSWDPGADWDNHNVYSGVYISADRIGNNGSVIGSLSVSGGRIPSSMKMNCLQITNMLPPRTPVVPKEGRMHGLRFRGTEDLTISGDVVTQM